MNLPTKIVFAAVFVSMIHLGHGVASGQLLGTLDLANADVIIPGINAGDESGRSVNFAGDVNGDGIDDILIGGLQADQGGIVDAGESYLIYGRAGAQMLSGIFDLNNADV